MRKALLILGALIALAVMATPALAGGKSRAAKKPKSACKPVVMFVFEGTVSSVGTGSISADVTAANKHAQRFGASVTMTVGAATKVVRDDVRVTLADVQPGDDVTLQARACKSVSTATTLVARHISATSPVVVEPVVEEPVEPAA